MKFHTIYLFLRCIPEEISGAGFKGKLILTLDEYGHVAVPGGQYPKLHEPDVNPMLLPKGYNWPTKAVVMPPLLPKSDEAKGRTLRLDTTKDVKLWK